MKGEGLVPIDRNQPFVENVARSDILAHLPQMC